MKRQILMFAALTMLAGCSTSEAVRSGEGSRDAATSYRSAGWTREHCADCGGRGPSYAGSGKGRARR